MAPVGHYYTAAGASAFRVFAPGKGTVDVVLVDEAGEDSPHSSGTNPPHPGRTFPLVGDALGYWTVTLPALAEGTRYWLRVDGVAYPDVASRRQPDGVHGPSQIAAPRTVHSPGWRGVAMADAIIYELHLGTFTPEGTLRSAQGRLEHLAQLGITVVELMPIAAFR